MLSRRNYMRLKGSGLQILIALLCVYIWWGGFVLQNNLETKRQCCEVWKYGLLGIIYGLILLMICLISLIILINTYEYDDDEINRIINKLKGHAFILISVSDIILLIRGSFILIDVQPSCMVMYDEYKKYYENNVWLLYEITFWGSISLTCIGLSIIYFINCLKIIDNRIETSSREEHNPIINN